MQGARSQEAGHPVRGAGVPVVRRWQKRNNTTSIYKVMPEPVSPQNALFQLAQIFVAPSNLTKVQKVMNNPMRNLVQLQMASFESLATSFFAAEGKPENMPTAMAMFLIERAEDPIRLLGMLIGMGMPQKG